MLSPQAQSVAPINSNHLYMMLCFESQYSVHSATSCKFPPGLLMAMDDTDVRTKPTKTTSSKTVRFKEETEAHESIFGTKEESQKLWYSNCDYESFRKENLALAQSLREKMKLRQTSWFELFQTEYENICKSSPNQQEELVQPSDKHLERFHISYLGLESLVLQSYLCDRARRQEALYNQVDYWQSMELLDKSTQEKMLQTISQGLSRPCCRIARFTGNVVALDTADNV